MEIRLDGRVIVVTGGTRGVGRAAVEKLAGCGAQVVFQGRNTEAAKEAVAAGAKVGPEPIFVAGDLGDYGSISKLVEYAWDRFGRLDGALGSGQPSPETHPAEASQMRVFNELSPEDIEGSLRLGLLPRAYLVHAASRFMKMQGYGKIVLITTDAGRVPTPGESMIGTAAAGVIYLTRSAGMELARDGVRLNAVAISITSGTPSYERFEALLSGAPTPERITKVEDTPLNELEGNILRRIEKRMAFGIGSAAEVAEVVAFLLAPESDGITGATVSLNRGGYFPSY